MAEEWDIVGMASTVIVSPKGQVTLPARLRRALGIHEGDALRIGIDGDAITLERVSDLRSLSARASRYARAVEPVTDVDAYYQSHRGE